MVMGLTKTMLGGWNHGFFVEQLCWNVYTHRFFIDPSWVFYGEKMYFFPLIFQKTITLWIFEASICLKISGHFVVFCGGNRHPQVGSLDHWVNGPRIRPCFVSSSLHSPMRQGWCKTTVGMFQNEKCLNFPRLFRSNYSNLENLFMIIVDFFGGSLVWNIAHKLLETRWQHVVVAVSAIFPSPVDLQVHHCCVLQGGVGHPFPKIESRL